MQQLPFEPHAVINSPFPQLCISDVVSLKSVGGRVNWAAGDDGASQNITQLPQVFSITSFFFDGSTSSYFIYFIHARVGFILTAS